MSLRSYNKHHEIIGIWHIANVRMRHPAVGSKPWYIRTNADGMRADRNYAKAKPSGITRITALGDSFTFGYSVEVEERYTNRLEQHFDHLEVLNFGLNSAGVDQEYLIYEQIAKDWESDILMISPYLNNVARAQMTYHVFQGPKGERVVAPKPYFELIGDDLVLKNVPVIKKPTAEDEAQLEAIQRARTGGGEGGTEVPFPFVDALKRRVRDHQLKYLAIKVFPYQPYHEYRAADAPEWRLAKRILLKLREICRQKHLVITPLPAWSTILNPALATYRDRFAELNDPSAGILVLDILPYFLELGFAEQVACFVSTRDTHYSALGHEVAARGMASELVKAGLLSRARQVA